MLTDDLEMSDPLDKHVLTLKELLNAVTMENTHTEIDTGISTGKEMF